ncbi:MAG TPA: hypothetical protein VFV38_10075, partial [Ktedonobacteraceae bacterium]|nr:hypothetical protein [Ktedonobacteraceae bacterium]
LTREQAQRLHSYLQAYRQYALTAFLPSTRRNTTLRLLQGLQGKLIEALDQPLTPLQVRVTSEERGALTAMVTELLMLYATQPESQERLATLADLAALKSSLKAY